MQAFIYDALNNHEPEFATELHQFPHAPPFVFSEFVQTGPYQTNEDGLTCERGYWVVNSDQKKLIDAVANQARQDEIQLGHTKVPIEGVDIEAVETERRAKYRTMSPVYVSQYEGEKRVDLHPDDGMWFARVRDNVRDRMEANWEETPNELVIEDVHWFKTSRLRTSGDGWATGTRMELTLRTDPRTSEFIQTMGLGERTGLGFGCVMPVDQIPERWR